MIPFWENTNPLGSLNEAGWLSIFFGPIPFLIFSKKSSEKGFNLANVEFYGEYNSESARQEHLQDITSRPRIQIGFYNFRKKTGEKLLLNI